MEFSFRLVLFGIGVTVWAEEAPAAAGVIAIECGMAMGYKIFVALLAGDGYFAQGDDFGDRHKFILQH